jgi:transcriptional regulator with XRE-family HTH domain
MRNRSVAMAFGRVLRELRLRKKLSQEALALRAGLDRTYPSLLERGQRQPTLAVVLAVAEVLEVSPTLLVNRTAEELRK